MKTQHLSAKLQEVSYIDANLNVKLAVAQSVHLSNIADAVIQHPSQELEKNILTGMLFPVILVENTREEYDAAVYGLSNAKAYDPSKPYLALIGNQRLAIARKYFKSIDAFIADKGIESIFIKLAYEEEHGRF